MSEPPFRLPRPEGEEPILHLYDILIHADHTHFVTHVYAETMSAAKNGADRYLQIPGVDEQAVRMVISKRGASELPDWEIIGPEVAAAFGDLLVIAEPHLSHEALTRFTGVLAKAGGRA